MLRVIDFLFAARPMLLLPIWSIFLISYRILNYPRPFSFNAFLVLAGASLMTAGVYYINQIYDYESDLINRKLGFLQSGFIGKREMASAYLAASIVSLVIGYLTGLLIFLLLLVVLLIGFFYSAPPLRLKDRPLWGLLTNSIGYGAMLPMIVPGFFGSEKNLALLLVSYFLLTVSAAYLLTTIPDREGDSATGKNTLAARFSNRTLLLSGIVLIILSLAASLFMKQYYLFAVSAISLLFSFYAYFRNRESAILLACKFPILLMSLLAGYYYPSYLVFIVVLIAASRLYYRERFNINYPRLG
jgi:4-hydroxybenzoate polyprenyltransferase